MKYVHIGRTLTGPRSAISQRHHLAEETHRAGAAPAHRGRLDQQYATSHVLVGAVEAVGFLRPSWLSLFLRHLSHTNETPQALSRGSVMSNVLSRLECLGFSPDLATNLTLLTIVVMAIVAGSDDPAVEFFVHSGCL